LAIRLLAAGDVEPNPGPQRRQQLAGLFRLALGAGHLFAGPSIQTYLTPGDKWFNPVVEADLLQLCTDAQGAAGGGARSDLN